MPLTNRRTVLKSGAALSLTGLGSLAGCTGGGSGGEYPSDTINFIVPFSTGGGSDTWVRTLQPELEDELGVSMQVDNRSGGGQWVGLGAVATAESDGYTIGTCVTPSAAIAALINPPEADPQNLEPLCGFATSHTMLVCNSDYPEFENDLQAAFDAVEEGSVGGEVALLAGSQTEITIDLLAEEHGIPFEGVGYDGSAPSIQAAGGGETTFAAPTDTGAVQAVEEGTVLPVGCIVDTRSPIFPDAPAISEDLGYSLPTTATSTRPIMGHVDIPDDRKTVIADAVEVAVNSDSVQEWGEETGNVPQYLAPDSSELEASWGGVFDTMAEEVDLSQY